MKSDPVTFTVGVGSAVGVWTLGLSLSLAPLDSFLVSGLKMSSHISILLNLHEVCHIAGMPSTMKRPHGHMVAMPALPGNYHILASDKERPFGY